MPVCEADVPIVAQRSRSKQASQHHTFFMLFVFDANVPGIQSIATRHRRQHMAGSLPLCAARTTTRA